MRDSARLLLLFALGVTAMLLVDYTSRMPTYCDGGGGCAAVRASGFGHVAGIPIPIFGAVALSALFLLSLFDGPWARRLTVAGGVVGGLSACGFIALQLLIIGHICELCMLVDGALVVVACLLLVAHRLDRGDSASRLRGWAWAALGLLALLAPTLWPLVRGRPALPPEIRALHQPGKLNVVEFADFECPFCRQFHPSLKAAIEAQAEGSVHLIRLNVPLPFHHRARGAALAQLCADAEGRGEAMAEILFTAANLSPAANRQAAGSLGLDLDAYDACLLSEETEARLEAQIELFRAVGGGGLPTTFIGERVLVGWAGDEALAEHFADPERGPGMPLSAYLGLMAIALAALVYAGRRRDAESPQPA